jgi:hypothetical protein
MIFLINTPFFRTLALVLLSYVIKWRNCPMKAMNSAMVLEEAHIDSEERFVPSSKAESLEGVADHYDEPGFFFKGAVFGLLLCLPIWAVIFWLIF